MGLSVPKWIMSVFDIKQGIFVIFLPFGIHAKNHGNLEKSSDFYPTRGVEASSHQNLD